MMRVFGSDARVNELPQDSATAVVDRLNIRPFSKQVPQFLPLLHSRFLWWQSY